MDYLGYLVKSAIEKSDVKELTNLINQGVRIDEANINGDTLLHLAASSHSLDVINSLIDNGALIEAKNNKNETPLMIAADNGSSDVFRLLVARGADYTECDNFGEDSLSKLSDAIGDLDRAEEILDSALDIVKAAEAMKSNVVAFKR